jgi:thiamine biosynthesis protein ThiC
MVLTLEESLAMKLISLEIHKAIREAVLQARTAEQCTINVYVLAERIRVENLEENVALEQIVELIVAHAGSGICFEFDPTAVVKTLLGTAMTKSEAGAPELEFQADHI